MTQESLDSDFKKELRKIRAIVALGMAKEAMFAKDGDKGSEKRASRARYIRAIRRGDFDEN